MGLITLYPYKISAFNDWYASSGMPVNSGSVDYINEGVSHPTVDDTYISNSGTNSIIRLHFKGEEISPYNTVSNAIVRMRMAYNGGDDVIVGISNAFNNEKNHESTPYLINEGNNDSIYGLPSLKLSSYGVSDGGPLDPQLGASGHNPLSTFSTFDFEMYTEETAKYNYLAGTYFKDGIVYISSPSGLRISSAEIILDVNDDNGMPMNIIGHSNAIIRKEYMQGNHLSNMRYWGVDTPHPTGFFSYYTNFNGSGIYGSFLTSKYMDGASNAVSLTKERFNIYSNPIVMTSGHPSNYVNAVCMEGSGTYPGTYFLQAPNTTVQNTAWTYYFSLFPKDTNDIFDDYRPLIRWGGDDSFPSESFCFYVVPKDGGHILPYDYLEVTYKSSGGTVKSKNLYQSTYKPFHNTNEPAKIIISYSGQSFGTYNNPSGTMKFYVDDNSLVDEHRKSYFRYLGEVSDVFYNEDRSYDGGGYVTIGGTPQFNGGSIYSLEDSDGRTFFTEIGHNFNYYSGIKTVDGIQFLDSRDFDKLITSRKHAQNYISNSGDGRYIQFDISGSGKVVEFMHFNIGSGNAGSYEMINTRLAHDGYITINPSSTYVEYKYTVNTNHPSGVDIIFNINRRGIQASEGTISFEQTAQSGTHTGIAYSPKIYGFDEHQPYNNDGISFNIITHTHPINSHHTTNVEFDYVRLYLDNVVVATTGTETIPLYTYSEEEGISSSIELYVEGTDDISEDIDLFIKGHSAVNEGTYLYIKSGVAVSGQTTLHTDGIGVENTTMPLFINGPVVHGSSGNFPLFILGTANSGAAEDLLMYMEGPDLYEDRILPLVITGERIAHSSSINLFLKSDADFGSNSLSLHIDGPDGSYSGIPMHVRGLGTTSGSIPYTDGISLFIARGSEDSTDERLRLFIGGPNGVLNSTPMYIAGAYIQTSSTPLYTEGSPIDITASLKNYIHGF